MAQFYQSPNPTNDPNYLGSSKEPDRVQANTGLGQLFEGIGNTVSKAGPAVQNLFQERIKNDARELIDPIMSEHGTALGADDVKSIAGTGAKGRVRALQARQGLTYNDDTADSALPFAPSDAQTQAAIGLFDSVTNDKPLPQPATQEIKQLDRMNNAYRAGNLSDSYYNSQMLAVVSKLKARYPGWNDEIDQSVSQITGIQPANALRRSLQADIQANQAMLLSTNNSDDKFREKYRAEIAAQGYDPDKTDMSILRPAVSDYIGRREILKGKQLRTEVGSPEAEATLTDTLQNVAQGAVAKMGNQAQGNKGLSDFRQEAQQLGMKGGSQQEIDQLYNNIMLRKQEVDGEMDRVAYKPIEGRQDGHSPVTLIKEGATKYQAIKTAQLKQFDDLAELVKTKNFSALERQTNMLKEQGNRDLTNLFDRFPQARVASAINAAFPNNPTFSNRFLEVSDILPEFQKQIKTGLGNAILSGTDKHPAPTPTEAVKSYGAGQDTGAVYKETVKQYDLVISKENKNIPNATHVAKQFFKDQDFYDKLDDNGRMKLFMTMVSPEKTKFVQSLTINDPDIGGLHSNWVKYAAGDIWRRNSDDLNSLITTKGVDIKFNSKTLLFEDATKYDVDTTSARMKTDTNKKIQSINNAITLLKPVVGDDAQSVLGALGIDPAATKEPGLLGSIGKSIGDKIENWGNESQNKDIKEGRKPVGKQSLTPVRQGEPHQTRGVIQGNLSDTALVDSTTFDIPPGMTPAEYIAELRKRHQL